MSFSIFTFPFIKYAVLQLAMALANAQKKLGDGIMLFEQK
jgi:hypothetical protein